MSLRYDNSVRNSENTVVQFTYGDDSLNPEKMENNDRPVNFDRLHLSVTQLFPCPHESCLLREELSDMINSSLATNEFQCLLPEGKRFLAEIRSFFQDILEKQESILESCEEDQMQQRIWNTCRFTSTQVDKFLKIALSKYTKAMVEPGESVGAIGAQSISEPGTQMTLKVSNGIDIRSYILLKYVAEASCSSDIPLRRRF